MICDVNVLMEEFLKYGKLFIVKFVFDLLIMLGLQYVQVGKVNEVLLLYWIMYDYVSQEDLEKYFQILMNLGCLYICIVGEML